eukprot:COSAG05_NODE_468_length_9525_cov_30.402292_1_plen_65_part_00
MSVVNEITGPRGLSATYSLSLLSPTIAHVSLTAMTPLATVRPAAWAVGLCHCGTVHCVVAAVLG